MLYRENTPVIGKMMILEGLILLVPLAILPFYPEEWRLVWQFIVPSALSIGIGSVICLFRKEKKKINSSRVVVFAWIYGSLLAAAPFWLFGNLTPIQAVFESVSGFTTTGLSVLDVSKTPRLFLFYRGFLQYIGGLGFVLMMLVFIQGKFSMDLYQAEGHPDKLMPNIGKTAKVIFTMYSFFLVIGTVVYTIFGMPIFDSVVHTMCALSTGGFSNRLESIGYYDSLPIELITILLMLIGTTNFSLLLLVFRGKIKAFFQSSEIRFLAGLTILMVPLMTLFLTSAGDTAGHSFRLSLFNAFSAISTTGYATSGYTDWPETALAIMVVLMVIGGGIGSTAGGIKLGRVCILLKNLWRNVRKKMLPDRTVTLTYYHRGTENEVLENERVQEASAYAEVYILLFITGTLALTFFSGCTLLEAAFEFASSLGTVGLSIGVTSMETSSLCLLIEIVGMIFGRLEIFVIIKAFCKQ